MKRLIIVDVLFFLLVVLTGFIWTLQDQADYNVRLNHFGLSPDALVLTPNKKAAQLTPRKVSEQLAANPEFDDALVLFRADKGPVYIYGKGNFPKLPMRKGTWFAANDLQSNLPMVIVGEENEKLLYTGATQRYLPNNGHYLPVIGILNSNVMKELGKTTLINAYAESLAQPNLSGLKVYAEGTDQAKVKKVLEGILGGKATTYGYNAAGSGSWLQSSGLLALRIVVLIALTGLVAGLYARMLGPNIPAEAPFALKKRLILLFTGRVALHASVFGAIGVFINWTQFYWQNALRMVVCVFGLFVLLLVLLASFLKRRTLGGYHRDIA